VAHPCASLGRDLIKDDEAVPRLYGSHATFVRWRVTSTPSGDPISDNMLSAPPRDSGGQEIKVERGWTASYMGETHLEDSWRTWNRSVLVGKFWELWFRFRVSRFPRMLVIPPLSNW